jgi:hypothetical protein
MWWIIVTLVVLIAISYEDFKNRSVNIFLFITLAGLLIYSALQRGPFSVMVTFTFVNLLYVLFLMLICCFYLYLKYKTIAIFKFIGEGDLIFFLVIAVWFSPINFIFFNTVTFSTALTLHFFVIRLSKSYSQFGSIPLAGFQSISLAAVILYTKMI